MRLIAYLTGNNISVPDFARLISCDKGTVYRWLKGEVLPLPKTMMAIRKATKGAVTADDFLDEEETRAREKDKAEETP